VQTLASCPLLEDPARGSSRDEARHGRRKDQEGETLDDKKNVRFSTSARSGECRRLAVEGVMPDFLHLSEKGYQIWADAMDPLLKQLLGK
jgi:lysophospholipase L1-like esterase